MTEAEEMEELAHRRRKERFIREGLEVEQAHELAGRMMMRDRDPFDDRRVCFECVHLAGKLCTKITDRFHRPTMQLRFILQRCDHFHIKGQSK